MCFNPEFPAYTARRMTRSSDVSQYSFTRDAAGLRICSKYPYSFNSMLERQNIITSFLEDKDEVYRGDIEAPPGYSPLGADEEARIIAMAEQESDSNSDCDSILSSPMAMSVASDTTGVISVPSRHYSLTVTDYHHSPPPPVTYSREEALGTRLYGLGSMPASGPVRSSPRLSHGEATRFSGRLLRRELQLASSRENVAWQMRLRYGLVAHGDRRGPAPIIDARQVVMGVVSPGPVDDQVWWDAVCTRATTKMMVVHDKGGFLDDRGNHSNLRLGVEYRDQVPSSIKMSPSVEGIIGRFGDDTDLEAISRYQNHLYEQFFPGYATLACTMAELKGRKIALPEFSGSALSTTEIHVPRPGDHQKRWEVRFDTVEAITVLGRYNHKRRGHLILWDDDSIFDMPPGTTVLIPTGAKRSTFITVAADEKQFLFRQFFHASVLRWMEKGGYSDTSFELEALDSETDEATDRLLKWESRRLRRGKTGQKLFSKLGDVFTV